MNKISILIFLILICQILNAEYDLESGKEKTIGTLSIYSSSYYFYIKAETGQKLDIKMSMDYVDFNPVAFVSVEELTSKNDFSFNKDSFYVENLSRENNKSIYKKRYSVSASFIKYVSFEIKPYIDLSNFKILIKVSGGFKPVILFATLIPSVICCIICTVIVFWYVRIRSRRRLQMEQQATFNNVPQQLYNTNPGQYPPQGQYQYPPPSAQYPPQPIYPPQAQNSADQQMIGGGQIYQ